jgi:hypothetical protein
MFDVDERGTRFVIPNGATFVVTSEGPPGSIFLGGHE